MAKKLNSMPDYQYRGPKAVHDVSQSTAFTSSTGMLLPVYYDMLHTGDEIHFTAGMFTRMNPLSVGALAEIDLHLDYFFVPLSVMYTPAPSMFYQTDDLFSSLFKDSSGSGNASGFSASSFPLYTLDGSLRAIRSQENGGVNAPQKKGSQQYFTNTFDCSGKAAYRLCDMFDLAYNSLFSNQAAVDFNPKFTPWFLAAYQACYELYFRNDDREPKSYCYQLDNQFSRVGTNYFVSTDLLRLNYVSAYKDYFNSIKVSPIGSSVSSLDGAESYQLLTAVNSYLYSNTSYTRISADGVGPAGGSTPNGDLATVSSYPVNSNFTVYPKAGLSAANIRQLFMVDKLLRVTGRAEKNYESQFLAHFGIKIPHDVMHNITHIGHDRVTLSPSQIISTADTWNGTTGSALGEVGGQGVATLSGKKHNFKAPFHGVFIAIYHANPRMRYYAGVNKLHDLSSPMSFWQPEYDRRGMQPLFAYETMRLQNDFSANSTRVGWQFAYEQFKRKYDRVTDVFRNPFGASTVNEYSPWVLSRTPYNSINTGTTVVYYTNLLSYPTMLDSIMQVKYQTTWIDDLEYNNSHLLCQTDPFIHDFRMNCKKVNSMSEYGEPLLDS